MSLTREGVARTLRWALVGAVTATCAACAPGSGSTEPSALPVRVAEGSVAATVRSFEDATVTEDRAGRNSGSSTELVIEGGGADDQTYVKFTVSGVPDGARVDDATLTLQCPDGTDNGPGVRQVSNSWTEQGITWRERPAEVSTSDLDNEGEVEAGGTAAFSLTSAVKGNGTYSFVLAQNSADALGCSSSEHGTATRRPQISVSYTTEPGYSVTKAFDIADTTKQQGLAIGGGHLWVCFDTGGGSGKIIQYTMTGTPVKTSPELELGHCSELAYREADGTLYASDYRTEDGTAHIRVVDMSLSTPAVVKSFDTSSLGLPQMVTIDNGRDQLVVKASEAPYRFVFHSLAGEKASTRASRLREVTYDEEIGTPQGMEVVGDELLFLTSHRHPSTDEWDHNRIDVFTLDAELERSDIEIPEPRESQGLAVDPDTGTVHLGLRWNPGNGVYTMDQPYRPSR